MNLFGKKKKAPPRLTESIQQLREAMTVLEKREKHLEKQMEQTVQEAKKKAKAKDKRGALFQLKRKKLFEKQIDQIYGKKNNIEVQIMALENAASNKDLLSAMQGAGSALRASIQESDVENVSEVMDNITDSIQLADELSDAMAQPIGPVMDEDELTAELEQLESEMLDDDLLKAPVLAPSVTAQEQPIELNAPSAPTRLPQMNESVDEKEARELRELDALMNS